MKISQSFAGPENRHWYPPALRYNRPKGFYIVTSDDFHYGPFDSEDEASQAQRDWSAGKREFNRSRIGT